MIAVVQAFDRTSITELAGDDPAALETKFEMARKLFSNRSAWLKSHQRIAVLNRLAHHGAISEADASLGVS